MQYYISFNLKKTILNHTIALIFLHILGINFLLPLDNTATAQSSINSPTVEGATIAACDDYATQVLNNPWDMNSSDDINNYIPNVDMAGFNNPTFNGGVFSATAATGDPFFHLLSPPLSSAVAVGGRWGEQYPIDTSKYNTLSIRMFTDVASHIQILWNTGQDYMVNWVQSAPIYTSPGWNVYTVDLNTIGHFLYNGANLPWNAVPATGLRIDPTAIQGATIIIDWISLYSDDNCGSFLPSITKDLEASEYFNLYLDNDTNPFNGFTQQLLAGSSSWNNSQITVNAKGLMSGSYRINGFVSSEYATLLRSNPWDMNGPEDLALTTEISVSGGSGFSGGAFSGTTTGTNPFIFLALNEEGINAAKFSKLSLKLERSSSDAIYIAWVSGGQTFSTTATALSQDAEDANVYVVNLAAQPNWQGTINTLLIKPTGQANAQFSLHFVALQSDGYVNNLQTPPILFSPGVLTVNQPPLLSFLQPDAKGGEALQPWNMSTTNDIQVTANLSLAEILPFNLVDGLVGDFFHGANINGNDDPINYSTFHTINPVFIDASVYHNLTYKLLVEGEVDLVLGSVARVNWAADDNIYGTTEDIVVFGGWNDYTLDLKTAERVPGTKAWEGVISSFRVDSHEFTSTRHYYFDYVHLRADDRANSNFAITYIASDPDNTLGNKTVALYYNTTKSTSGGTLITQRALSNPASSYTWNTSSLPAGTYYIYGVVSDGINSTRRLASGPVVITRDWHDSEAPILSLQTPADNYSFDSWLQVKGFALDRVQIAQVEVKIDNNLVLTTQPSLLDLEARTNYSNYVDSSNAGFDNIIDTRTLANGQHSITVTAVDTAGIKTERTFSVTKASGSTPTLISDPEPNGLPQALPGSGQPLATPRLRSPKVNIKNIFSARLSSLVEGCSAEILTGNKKAANDLVASYSVTADNINSLTVCAKKVPWTKKRYFMRVRLDCGVMGEKYSKPVAVRNVKPGKAGYKGALKALRKRIKKI